MPIRIVHLISGEQIITRVVEVKNSEGEPVYFEFVMPMLLTLFPPEEGEETKINYLPWSPFSSSATFKVAFENVMSVGDVQDYVLDSYLNIVQPKYPVLSQEELSTYIKQKEEKNV
tara:strand:+ start:104 stop:451 length:348 start_codon:yes stop_codon:yes gene_type:complete